MVMDDGAPTLVRDGHSFEAGFLGGGVVEAVEGSPAALEHAHTYRQYTIAGWTLYLGGLGLSLTGLGLWRAGELHDNPQQANTGEVLALAGVAALITGAGFLLGAQPHLWDAVNLYNDEVDRRLRLSYWPPPAVPPYRIPPTLPPPALVPSSGAEPSPASPGPASPAGSTAPGSTTPGPASPGSTAPGPASPSLAPPVAAPAPSSP
jgi:hypothetical protein